MPLQRGLLRLSGLAQLARRLPQRSWRRLRCYGFALNPANLALAESNARLAGEIAVALLRG